MSVNIGREHFELIEEQISSLIIKNQVKIDESYTKNENELTLTISVKMGPNKIDGTDITTNLSFVESKIKDSRSQTVPDRQKQLFNSVEKLAEDGVELSVVE